MIDDAQHLQHSVVREALVGGLDWWQVRDLLNLHPQDACDTYAHLAASTRTPAQQRPRLAVVCTAGLAAEHDMLGVHGIDLDSQHSVTSDPTVSRLRWDCSATTHAAAANSGGKPVQPGAGTHDGAGHPRRPFRLGHGTVPSAHVTRTRDSRRRQEQIGRPRQLRC